MKLTEKLWEMWHYAVYGQAHVDSSVGHSLGWDMFHVNLRTGRENYPGANIHLNWAKLGKEWSAMSAAEQQAAIKRFRDVEDAAMEKLRKKFADKDRAGFCEIVAAVEAEMDGKKPEVPKTSETPETPEVPEKKPAGKKGGK